MNPIISIKKGENFVHSCVRGPITWELLAEQMTKTAEKAKEWDFRRHLVDFREAKKQLGVLDDYDIAHKKAREYGFKPGSKHALIVRYEEIDGFSFVETVFRNAGYNLRIFTEEDEALDWIKK